MSEYFLITDINGNKYRYKATVDKTLGRESQLRKVAGNVIRSNYTKVIRVQSMTSLNKNVYLSTAHILTVEFESPSAEEFSDF